MVMVFMLHNHLVDHGPVVDRYDRECIEQNADALLAHLSVLANSKAGLLARVVAKVRWRHTLHALEGLGEGERTLVTDPHGDLLHRQAAGGQ